MAITNELREWARGLFNTRETVLAIADRIDAECERQLEALYHDMSDAEYIELPKDADGEYIHIGDRMEWVRYEDDDPTIVRKVSAVGAGVFFAWSDEQGRYAQYDAQAYRHHKQPTVEDVLRDMHAKLDEVTALYVGEAIDSDERDRDEARIFAEYTSKLRLAGEGE